MCGIVGFASKKADYDKQAVLKEMMDRIAHRGPDGEGSYLDDGVALGHRRLSIIDLQGGAQPMYNEDGSMVVIFNGEIYNFQELKAQLEEKGHVFATRQRHGGAAARLRRVGQEPAAAASGYVYLCAVG